MGIRCCELEKRSKCQSWNSFYVSLLLFFSWRSIAPSKDLEEGEMRRTLFVLKLAERNDRAVFPQLILKDKRLKVSPE